ncbi:hypothetical protein BJF82_11700 [Kytococcus sp. CUA-901]|nr:hypothetical protein BJF82_11700 [Kytococcus sp. CUA-901]
MNPALEWPVTLEGRTAAGDPVRLRPLLRSDWRAYQQLRRDNLDHLREGTADDPDAPGMGAIPPVRTAYHASSAPCRGRPLSVPRCTGASSTGGGSPVRWRWVTCDGVVSAPHRRATGWTVR